MQRHSGAPEHDIRLFAQESPFRGTELDRSVGGHCSLAFKRRSGRLLKGRVGGWLVAQEAMYPPEW